MRSIFALAALPFAFAAPVQDATQATAKYIVVLKPESSIQSLNLLKRGSLFESVSPFHTYEMGSFKGFAASMTANQLKDMRADPKVAYVELDGMLHTQDKIAKRDDDDSEEPDTDSGVDETSQTNSTWGLSRISHRQKGATDYIYDPSAGEGACAYIIDTGIYTAHDEFEGRATFVKNYDTVDGTDADMYGHGTHVAGTIGSKTYGVAKKAKLFAMKACNQNGDCPLSGVIAAIGDTITDSKQRDCPKGVVINMSLGAPNADWGSIKDAVKQAVDAGIFIAVAAGNENDDSSKYSPASSPGVCAAGAVDNADVIASFSNYGKPVAVFAPGVDVLSTYNAGQGATTLMSGTSMASPHLAGLGAYLLALDGNVSPAALCKKIQTLSTKNVVTGIKALSGTVNYLAFNGMA
jgi:subtilisin family serine protease